MCVRSSDTRMQRSYSSCIASVSSGWDVINRLNWLLLFCFCIIKFARNFLYIAYTLVSCTAPVKGNETAWVTARRQALWSWANRDSQSFCFWECSAVSFLKQLCVCFRLSQNKTNQIVPEVTVELRGATIGWASKDKSSKKNVLEVCLFVDIEHNTICPQSVGVFFILCRKHTCLYF